MNTCASSILITWHETLFLSTLCFKKQVGRSGAVVLTYHSTDAASADGGLELAVQFLDCAGRVEALGQQDDPVQEEK